MHYNGINSYLCVNGVEIYKLKAKGSEINVVPLCLGNNYEYSVDFDSIDFNVVLDIHKYLMKNHNIK